jgi:geranylgeranyl diphosphate synthase type II
LNITEQQQKLSDLIEKKLAELDLPDEPSSLYDPVRYTLSLPGKRVRPYLVLVSCGMCGGTIEEALPAAISIELLHNFTLLHDDIMDKAAKRRGKPSVFKKWGADTAILSGDVIYAKAFEQLQYYGYKEQYSKEQYHTILDIFLESSKTVCEGQANDLTFEKRQDVSIDEYLHMIEGKTSALISGALAIGAAVAGSESNQIEELRYVGKKTGIAFQIQDDLLDAIADPDKFGKRRGGDIIEGKKTYLILLALQRCDDRQKELLMKVLNSGTNTEKDINSVIKIYDDLNVIRDSKEAIEYHYQAAMDHLQKFDPSDFKTQLIEFLNRLITREY